MTTQGEVSCAEVDCKEMKREDLLQFSNVFASEFNNSSLHDRVLVFQIMEDGWRDGSESLSDSATCDSEKEGSRHGTRINFEKSKEVSPYPGQTSAVSYANGNNLPPEPNAQRRSRRRKSQKNELKRGEREEEEEKVGGKGEIEAGLKEDEKSDKSKKDEEASNKMAANKHKIFVHSQWLAVQSSYFRALFYSGMRESHSKEVVMKIAGGELQTHLTLVEAMYRLDVLNDKEFNLVLEVLVLANKYDVNLVFKKCKYILMSMPLTLEKCELILEARNCLLDCADLLGTVEQFLVKEFNPLDKTWTMDKFIELSETSLRILFSSNDLTVQSENTVFEANESQQSSLLSLVRFELLTVDFLYDVVRHHPVAERMAGFQAYFQKGLGYHAFSKARREQVKDQPIQRCSYTDNGPTYSWVIDHGIRQKLTDSQVVSSSPFWFQGYKMSLKLSYSTNSNSFAIFMYMLNLKEESFLSITWTATSNLFQPMSFFVSGRVPGGNRGRGRREVKSGTVLIEVPDTLSHTIDIWVKFNE